MDATTDGGPFWDAGDDRSHVFAPPTIATMLPLKARAAASSDIARFAVREETAAAAQFLRTARRAAG